jgi:hypothetical protein
MADPIFWSNVGIDVQTALAAAVTVTAVTKATTGVCTYTGVVNPANGDYISFTATGMYQINDRLFRIANVNTTTKTFELEGEDTTSFDTYINGSYRIVTFGASFNSVQSITVSGGDYEKADVTTIHDSVRKNVPTIAAPLTLSLTNFFDMTDPGFVECNKAYKAKAKRAIRLRFGSGAKMVMTGYVGAAGVPNGQAQGVVQTPVSIEAQNLPTVYAS